MHPRDMRHTFDGADKAGGRVGSASQISEAQPVVAYLLIHFVHLYSWKGCIPCVWHCIIRSVQLRLFYPVLHAWDFLLYRWLTGYGINTSSHSTLQEKEPA